MDFDPKELRQINENGTDDNVPLTGHTEEDFQIYVRQKFQGFTSRDKGYELLLGTPDENKCERSFQHSKWFLKSENGPERPKWFKGKTQEWGFSQKNSNENIIYKRADFIFGEIKTNDSQNRSGNAQPQSGSGNAQTQSGSGNAQPQRGSGNAQPQSGSENAQPQSGSESSQPQSSTGMAQPQSGSGNAQDQDVNEDVLLAKIQNLSIKDGTTREYLIWETKKAWRSRENRYRYCRSHGESIKEEEEMVPEGDDDYLNAVGESSRNYDVIEAPDVGKLIEGANQQAMNYALLLKDCVPSGSEIFIRSVIFVLDKKYGTMMEETIFGDYQSFLFVR